MIDRVQAAAYTIPIPTDGPESDGTLEWDSTTLVLVRVSGGGRTGAVRNLGRPGLVAEAISAVDVALWDLHARLLGVPLTIALDAVHDATPVYGSGGFTSYDDRLEGMAFDGVLAPEPGGVLRPDRDRPGLDLEVRVADLKPCRVV